MAEPSKRFRPADSEPEELSPDELEAESGEPLPDREAMSVIDANVAIPLNPSVAANVLAGGSPDGVEDSKAEEQQDDERPDR